MKKLPYVFVVTLLFMGAAVSRHIWIRALQADYHYSELRNLQGDRQNQFRLGAGIVFRAGGK
jgi:hypothetical protein